ncbi:MAG: type IA DNA topoisomerase [Lachnospiraceae bacterium]|jgi:DNA topoisomerase-3|nr:type IA DNA topoisomerase [Lachnospiraceae bacterium]
MKTKSLYITEKPSVAREFAKALNLNTKNNQGYMESEEAIVTWCVGHLVTMSYPEEYDRKYKRWSFDTLPFLPSEYKYEVISSAKNQYEIVKKLLLRKDVETIYVCTDSGREGEYIYRLVEMQVGVKGKKRKRVWIDSQTEEEILRGVREAKDLSEYDNLSASAYLRAKEDYLMGINFSRALTLKYGNTVSNHLHMKYAVISVGRVMTCVLGMVVRREREIREFVKTPFYRLLAIVEMEGMTFEGEWRVQERSKYFQTPHLYKDNGFLKKEVAKELLDYLSKEPPLFGEVLSLEKKREIKKPPLLYNLAELQNECSKLFKLSPDETLCIAQTLYEKKLITYPRTDARVLSTPVAKEIHKNIKGLFKVSYAQEFAEEIMEGGKEKGISKTKYVDDKQITDHYAMIPTGQGLGALKGLSKTEKQVYERIVRRFLSIFYPGAIYKKISLIFGMKEERFHASFKTLVDPGYLKVAGLPSASKEGEKEEERANKNFMKWLEKIKERDTLSIKELVIKEGETTPPKRYNSGSLILAMENAGQFIEDEQLREQIKGSGIGTSATRAEILKKLVTIQYFSLNKKTQIMKPTQLGEIIYDVVDQSIKPMLNPELTASWEKGLTQVAKGSITKEEYMIKLNDYVSRRTNIVRSLNNQYDMREKFQKLSCIYEKEKKEKKMGKDGKKNAGNYSGRVV